MLKITRISNPSAKGAVAVYARDQDAPNPKSFRLATLHIDIIRSLQLFAGQEVSEQLAQAINQEQAKGLARRDALRIVERKMVSKARLIEKLTRKKHDRALASSIALDLERLGIINEHLLADAIAASTLSRKPAGKRLIEQKLRARGIGKEIAAAASKEAVQGRNQLEDALSFGSSRAKRFSPRLDADAKKRRLFGQLARRGFDLNIARQVVDQLINSPSISRYRNSNDEC